MPRGNIGVAAPTFKYGMALAMVISYVKWQSIIWAIIHSIFSWAFVVYSILFY